MLKAASDGSLPVCCLQGGAGLPRASPHPQFPTGNVHVDPLNFAITAGPPQSSAPASGSNSFQMAELLCSACLCQTCRRAVTWM